MSTLTFNTVNLTPVVQTGGIYLTSSDLANALGYKESDSVTKIYNRNQDEFTPEMTLTVKLTAKGFGNGDSEKEQRIFSLRGAHLIAMFSRTEIAKEFRKWVLDILDKETNQATQHQDTLTHSEQQTLRELINRKLAHLDDTQRKKTYPQVWERIKNKFRVAKYEQLQRTQLADVIVYLSNMQLKGTDQSQQTPQITYISAEQKRQIEQAMGNVTRYFSHHTQKASSNLHANLRQKYGYAKLEQMTTEQLPLVLADLAQLQTLAHQVHTITKSIETQALHWLTHHQPEQVDQLLLTQKTALGLIAA